MKAKENINIISISILKHQVGTIFYYSVFTAMFLHFRQINTCSQIKTSINKRTEEPFNLSGHLIILIAQFGVNKKPPIDFGRNQ